mmetsp:Transcript_30841/g.80711  ORF Transcript_30841/g.80711 Transcript_30841/m.80711 type:complete len:233 (+) Transcript_30841:128-826(+)
MPISTRSSVLTSLFKNSRSSYPASIRTVSSRESPMVASHVVTESSISATDSCCDPGRLNLGGRAGALRELVAEIRTLCTTSARGRRIRGTSGAADAAPSFPVTDCAPSSSSSSAYKLDALRIAPVMRTFPARNPVCRPPCDNSVEKCLWASAGRPSTPKSEKRPSPSASPVSSDRTTTNIASVSRYSWSGISGRTIATKSQCCCVVSGGHSPGGFRSVATVGDRFFPSKKAA